MPDDFKTYTKADRFLDMEDTNKRGRVLGNFLGSRFLAGTTFEDGRIMQRRIMPDDAPGIYFPVYVTSDGGADGDATDPATWTYSAYSAPGSDGELLDTGLEPLMPMRPAYGRVDPAPDDSEAIARYDENGDSLILVMVGERVHRAVCGTEESS